MYNFTSFFKCTIRFVNFYIERKVNFVYFYYAQISICSSLENSYSVLLIFNPVRFDPTGVFSPNALFEAHEKRTNLYAPADILAHHKHKTWTFCFNTSMVGHRLSCLHRSSLSLDAYSGASTGRCDSARRLHWIHGGSSSLTTPISCFSEVSGHTFSLSTHHRPKSEAQIRQARAPSWPWSIRQAAASDDTAAELARAKVVVWTVASSC